ncbi:MAG TPA: transposase [Micromonosporaceae bacterium]
MSRHDAARSAGSGRSGVKQWTTTRPRDLPVGGRAVRLRWRKRRWYCPTPACPGRSFSEQVAQVPARARLTTRLREAVADAGCTIVQAARDHRVSWPVVAAANTRARHQGAAGRAGAGRGIRHRRGPPRRAPLGLGRAGRVVDHARRPVARRLLRSVRRPGLLAQVEGRTTAAVLGWLAARPQAWREQVRAVAIDMCTVFKAAIRQILPHPLLVVDHFHVVQPANRAVTGSAAHGEQGRNDRCDGQASWQLPAIDAAPLTRLANEEPNPVTTWTGAHTQARFMHSAHSSRSDRLMHILWKCLTVTLTATQANDHTHQRTLPRTSYTW